VSSKPHCSSFSQRKFGYYNKCNTTHPECIVLAVDGALVIDASLTRLTIFSLSSTLESPLPLDLKSLRRVLDLISSHLPCNQGTNCRVHPNANSVLQHQTAGRIEIASPLSQMSQRASTGNRRAWSSALVSSLSICSVTISTNHLNNTRLLGNSRLSSKRC
jgi:hypothetical protein